MHHTPCWHFTLSSPSTKVSGSGTGWDLGQGLIVVTRLCVYDMGFSSLTSCASWWQGCFHASSPSGPAEAHPGGSGVPSPLKGRVLRGN